LGSRSGPITINATTEMTTISLNAMSNIEPLAGGARAGAATRSRRERARSHPAMR
jgi:hypothetical protein